MRNKFVYSCSIKICAFWFYEHFFPSGLLESTFCFLPVVEVFSLQKVVKMLKEAAVRWWEVRWMRQMRQNFTAQFVQFCKCWLHHVWSGIVVEKNWALPVDQCQLQALQFSAHLIDLLSMLLRCNGFTGIQNAVINRRAEDHQTSDRDLFGYRSGFGKCFRASSQSKHWASHYWLLYKIHFSSHITNHKKWFDVVARSKRRHFKMIFLICSQLTRHSLIELSHLSTLFQMPKTVIERVPSSSPATSSAAVRGSASVMALNFVTVSFGWPATMLFIFKALVSFAKLLEPPQNCMFISSSWAKCIVPAASCSCCFTTHFAVE